MQHVDRGQKGHDGVNIYEKSWTNTLGCKFIHGLSCSLLRRIRIPAHPGSEAGYGSDFGGPGSGRNSRAGALSPSGDPYGKGALGGERVQVTTSKFGGFHQLRCNHEVLDLLYC